MEVKQLDVVTQPCFANDADAVEQFRSGQSEFSRLAARGGPFARAARVEFSAQADPGRNLPLGGQLQQQFQLVELLNHHHDTLARLNPQQSGSQERLVLETIAQQK
jgi:hypothetical protein